jgi:hypothetical protein
MNKLFDNTKVSKSLDPEAYTGATAGATVVDTLGHRDGMLVVYAGDITCTTGNTYRVQVMESDTSTGSFEATGIYVDFVGATGAAAGENTVKLARIPELNIARKRFLRVDLAMTATTTAWEGCGVLLLGESYAGPQNID